MSDETKDIPLAPGVYDFIEKKALAKGFALEKYLGYILTAFAVKHGYKEPIPHPTHPKLTSTGKGIEWAKPKADAPLHRKVLYFLYTHPGEWFSQKELHAAVEPSKKLVSVGTAIYKLRDEGKIEGREEPVPGQRRHRKRWAFRSLT